MNKLDKKRIAVIPWFDKENCFLVISGKLKDKKRYGDKWYLNQHQETIQTYENRHETTEPAITFTYRSKNVAAEWDGNYGPIQLWFKCDSTHEEAREHWLFDYAYGHGHWSQLAVDENNLYEAFNTGDYDHIFSILKKFVMSRESEILE